MHSQPNALLKRYEKIQTLIVIQFFRCSLRSNKLLNHLYYYFQITKKILDFIIDSNLSFNVSQSEKLQILLETVAGRKLNVPSRYKVMQTLDSEYEKMKIRLKELLSKQKYLCVTADVWTSHAQSYLGVTVHFVDESFNRRSFLLGFKKMKKRQTYDILAQALDDIFRDYSINEGQITNIVTDGGSAFCKMFKKYGDQIDAIVMDTIGDEIDDENDDNQAVNGENDVEMTMQTCMLDENGAEFVSEIITLNNEIDGSSTSTENKNDDEISIYFEESAPVCIPEKKQIKLAPQRRCVSHKLNLLPKDFEKNLDGVAKTAYKKTFDSLHSLWAIIRNSSYAKTICKEILGVILQFPTETRWNSRIDCVKQCNR